MSVVLSSISVSSLSSVYKSDEFNFINNNRDVNFVEMTHHTSAFDVSYPQFSQLIEHVTFNNSYGAFLTNTTTLSAILNTNTPFIDHYEGLNPITTNVKYDSFLNNFSISTSAKNETQFVGIHDYDLNLNILPLKNKKDIDSREFSFDSNYRDYQKIYTFDDSVFLQFKATRQPVEIKPDEYFCLYNSYNVASSHLSAYGFEINAVAGDRPLNSDNIYFENVKFDARNDNGPNRSVGIENGTMLCVWLSSETPESSASKVWMERWYDPNTTTQGEAYITQTNIVSTSFSNIVDIPCDKIISEKEKIIYQRFGPNKNSNLVKSLSTNLVAEFESLKGDFVSSVGDLSGYTIGGFEDIDNYVQFDGSGHAHIPSEDQLLIKNDINVNLWSKSKDWKTNNDSQLFGNYFNESGYGIFYNTGVPDNLISIPTSGNSVFALNNKGFKVFEKELKNDIGLSAMSVDYIKTDIFGNRWIYDSYNNLLFKIENDDLVVKTIELPDTTVVEKLECNSNNDLMVFDSSNKTLSSFNSQGTFLEETAAASYQDNFDVDLNDNVVFDFADYIVHDSQNRKIKVLGPTLSIDDQKVIFFNDKPDSIRLDVEDNIWVLIKNKIIKLDKNAQVLFSKTLDVAFTDMDAEMCFVKSYFQGQETTNLWIVFNKGKFIYILNEDGRVIKKIDLQNIFIGKNCATFNINIIGDFTGYDNKRKFEKIENDFISPNNSTCTSRVCLKCGDSLKISQIHYPTKYLKDWNNFNLKVENVENTTQVSFYINGYLVGRNTYDGVYQINYNNNTVPFIVGGNSGKLGAKNLEKTQLTEGYFKGAIDDIRVYNKALNEYEIKNLAKNKHFDKWESFHTYLHIPETTFLEEIDTFHINRYKGFKSNYFDIKIKNFSDNIDVQNLLKTYIRNNIHKFIPAYCSLNRIVFE